MVAIVFLIDTSPKMCYPFDKNFTRLEACKAFIDTYFKWDKDKGKAKEKEKNKGNTKVFIYSYHSLCCSFDMNSRDRDKVGS